MASNMSSTTDISGKKQSKSMKDVRMSGALKPSLPNKSKMNIHPIDPSKTSAHLEAMNDSSLIDPLKQGKYANSKLEGRSGQMNTKKNMERINDGGNSNFCDNFCAIL